MNNNANISKQKDERQGASILGSYIDALSWNRTIATISKWAEKLDSRYICICNVHSIVAAIKDLELQKNINSADMATPDGMPIALSLRKLGYFKQERINGPDLMWKYCKYASEKEQKIYFFGSTTKTLELLTKNLKKKLPDLKIVGTYSPSFSEISRKENAKIEKLINNSGANIVFVGLGCPKQEKWMASKRGRINSVMIGVGAAFDFHAGTVKRAPKWMQKKGLEWLFRLLSEPKRLWKRYLVTNTLFIVGAMREILLKK